MALFCGGLLGFSPVLCAATVLVGWPGLDAGELCCGEEEADEDVFASAWPWSWASLWSDSDLTDELRGLIEAWAFPLRLVLSLVVALGVGEWDSVALVRGGFGRLEIRLVARLGNCNLVGLMKGLIGFVFRYG